MDEQLLEIIRKGKESGYTDEQIKGVINLYMENDVQLEGQGGTLPHVPKRKLYAKGPTEEAQQESEPLNVLDRLDSSVGSFQRGFADMAGGSLESVAVAAQALDKAMGWKNIPIEEYATYKYGKKLREVVYKNSYANPEYQGDFWTEAVPTGLGSVAAFAAAGGVEAMGSKAITKGAMRLGGATAADMAASAVAGKAMQPLTTNAAKIGASELYGAVTSPMSITGGAAMGAAEFQAAKDAGLSDDEAFNVWVKNYFTGTTEAVPLEIMFRSIDRVTGRGILNAMKEYAGKSLSGGFVEFTQEAVQQYLANKIAAGSYDPDRDPMLQVIESGQVGGVIGMLIPTVGVTVRRLGTKEQADRTDARLKNIEDKALKKENEKVRKVGDPISLDLEKKLDKDGESAAIMEEAGAVLDSDLSLKDYLEKINKDIIEVSARRVGEESAKEEAEKVEKEKEKAKTKTIDEAALFETKFNSAETEDSKRSVVGEMDDVIGDYNSQILTLNNQLSESEDADEQVALTAKIADLQKAQKKVSSKRNKLFKTLPKIEPKTTKKEDDVATNTGDTNIDVTTEATSQTVATPKTKTTPKATAEKTVDNDDEVQRLIEYETDASTKETYEYKDAFKVDPRLAALQREKDYLEMYETMSEEDIKKYGFDREQRIAGKKENIERINDNLLRNPVKTTKPTTAKTGTTKQADIEKAKNLTKEYGEAIAPEKGSVEDKLTKIAKFFNKNFGWDITDAKASKTNNRVEFTIDGKQVNLPEGANIRIMGNQPYADFSMDDVINAKYQVDEQQEQKPKEKKTIQNTKVRLKKPKTKIKTPEGTIDLETGDIKLPTPKKETKPDKPKRTRKRAVDPEVAKKKAVDEVARYRNKVVAIGKLNREALQRERLPGVIASMEKSPHKAELADVIKEAKNNLKKLEQLNEERIEKKELNVKKKEEKGKVEVDPVLESEIEKTQEELDALQRSQKEIASKYQPMVDKKGQTLRRGVEFDKWDPADKAAADKVYDEIRRIKVKLDNLTAKKNIKTGGKAAELVEKGMEPSDAIIIEEGIEKDELDSFDGEGNDTFEKYTQITIKDLKLKLRNLYTKLSSEGISGLQKNTLIKIIPEQLKLIEELSNKIGHNLKVYIGTNEISDPDNATNYSGFVYSWTDPDVEDYIKKKDKGEPFRIKHSTVVVLSDAVFNTDNDRAPVVAAHEFFHLFEQLIRLYTNPKFGVGYSILTSGMKPEDMARIVTTLNKIQNENRKFREGLNILIEKVRTRIATAVTNTIERINNFNLKQQQSGVKLSNKIEGADETGRDMFSDFVNQRMSQEEQADLKIAAIAANIKMSKRKNDGTIVASFYAEGPAFLGRLKQIQENGYDFYFLENENELIAEGLTDLDTIALLLNIKDPSLKTEFRGGKHSSIASIYHSLIQRISGLIEYLKERFGIMTYTVKPGTGEVTALQPVKLNRLKPTFHPENTAAKFIQDNLLNLMSDTYDAIDDLFNSGFSQEDYKTYTKGDQEWYHTEYSPRTVNQNQADKTRAKQRKMFSDKLFYRMVKEGIKTPKEAKEFLSKVEDILKTPIDNLIKSGLVRRIKNHQKKLAVVSNANNLIGKVISEGIKDGSIQSGGIIDEFATLMRKIDPSILTGRKFDVYYNALEALLSKDRSKLSNKIREVHSLIAETSTNRITQSSFSTREFKRTVLSNKYLKPIYGLFGMDELSIDSSTFANFTGFISFLTKHVREYGAIVHEIFHNPVHEAYTATNLKYDAIVNGNPNQKDPKYKRGLTTIALEYKLVEPDFYRIYYFGQLVSNNPAKPDQTLDTKFNELMEAAMLRKEAARVGRIENIKVSDVESEIAELQSVYATLKAGKVPLNKGQREYYKRLREELEDINPKLRELVEVIRKEEYIEIENFIPMVPIGSMPVSTMLDKNLDPKDVESVDNMLANAAKEKEKKSDATNQLIVSNATPLDQILNPSGNYGGLTPSKSLHEITRRGGKGVYYETNIHLLASQYFRNVLFDLEMTQRAMIMTKMFRGRNGINLQEKLGVNNVDRIYDYLQYGIGYGRKLAPIHTGMFKFLLDLKNKYQVAKIGTSGQFLTQLVPMIPAIAAQNGFSNTTKAISLLYNSMTVPDQNVGKSTTSNKDHLDYLISTSSHLGVRDFFHERYRNPKDVAMEGLGGKLKRLGDKFEKNTVTKLVSVSDRYAAYINYLAALESNGFDITNPNAVPTDKQIAAADMTTIQLQNVSSPIFTAPALRPAQRVDGPAGGWLALIQASQFAFKSFAANAMAQTLYSLPDAVKSSDARKIVGAHMISTLGFEALNTLVRKGYIIAGGFAINAFTAMLTGNWEPPKEKDKEKPQEELFDAFLNGVYNLMFGGLPSAGDAALRFGLESMYVMVFGKEAEALIAPGTKEQLAYKSIGMFGGIGGPIVDQVVMWRDIQSGVDVTNERKLRTYGRVLAELISVWAVFPFRGDLSKVVTTAIGKRADIERRNKAKNKGKRKNTSTRRNLTKKLTD